MADKVYIFKCTPELDELIGFLAQHIKGGNEELFQKSLILMGIAIKSKLTNKKLAILDENDNVVDTVDII
jgi:hypothetical protein